MPARDELYKWTDMAQPLGLGRFDFIVSGDGHEDDYDPPHNSFHNFVHLGRWWTRIEGGHNLRRNRSRKLADMTDAICGATDGSAATMTTFPWADHAANTNWIYRLTAVGSGGVENQDGFSLEEIAISSGAALETALPNTVTGVQSIPQANGSFIVTFAYNPLNQRGAPADFQVYGDAGTGTINYAAALGTVAYVAGRMRYSFTTGILAGASAAPFKFAVRARGATATEGNLRDRSQTGATAAQYGTITTSGRTDSEIGPGKR